MPQPLPLLAARPGATVGPPWLRCWTAMAYWAAHGPLMLLSNLGDWAWQCDDDNAARYNAARGHPWGVLRETSGVRHLAGEAIRPAVIEEAAKLT